MVLDQMHLSCNILYHVLFVANESLTKGTEYEDIQCKRYLSFGVFQFQVDFDPKQKPHANQIL